MADIEDGHKWWIRYVIVPLIGGGGVIALLTVLLESPRSGKTVTEEPTSAVKSVLSNSSEASQEPDIPDDSGSTADPKLRSALARIDAADPAIRTDAVNTLAFEYGSSLEAKTVILAMLSTESVGKLSEQSLVNRLIILARHKPSSWSKSHLEQVREVIRHLDQRRLTKRERWALDELKRALS